MTAADDQRDAFALIRATIEGDEEAAEVILDHADLRAVAEGLAFRASCLAVMAFGSNRVPWPTLPRYSTSGPRTRRTHDRPQP